MKFTVFFGYFSLMNKEGQTPMNVASVAGFEHSVQYLAQFQSHHFYSGMDNITFHCY
jgi:hypothetical protein